MRKVGKLTRCPSCNQATYHVSYVVSDDMCYEHVICRHCKKMFVRAAWDTDRGEIVIVVHELAEKSSKKRSAK